MGKPPGIPNELFTYERKKRHWTQGDVADKISAPDERLIRRWERGEVAPTPHYRGKLAEVFGKTFLAQHTSPVSRLPLALSGLGGVGKSQIALEYAYRYREHYHTVLWLHAASYQALVAGVTAVTHRLDLPEKDAEDPKQLIEALKVHLMQLTRWLLIFDNVENLQLLEGFLPTEIKGHLLLTTLSQITGTRAHRIAVEPMDNNTGAELLLRRAKLIAIESTLEHMAGTDAAIARSLSEDMGGLPLAIDQAGAYVEETAMSLSEYVQRYQKERRDLLDRRGSWVSEYSEHPIPVAATLKLSFEKACERDPIAANILNFCAFLHPDAIPEELFQHDDSFKFGTTVFDEAIAALLRYSLIMRNTQDQTFSIHRLVQAVLVDTTMSPDIRKQWRERVVRALSAAFPNAHEFKNWRLCERLVSHALECATWTEDELTPTVEVAYLFGKAGIYLNKRGQYSEAETLESRALSIYKQQFGDEHIYTASALNNLALTFSDHGKYEQAEPLLVRALSIFKKELGTGYLDTVLVYDNLSNLYIQQGKYEQAEQYYQLTIPIWEQDLRTEFQLELANSLSNLATLYTRQGKYEQAEPLLVRALSIREEQLEAEHPDIAASQSNLAHVYLNLHKYEQAEPLLVRSLSIREQHFGAEHPGLALDLWKLASLLHGFGRCDQLEGRYEQAGGKYEQAGSLYQRSISILERLEATDPIQVIQVIQELYADLLHDQGLNAEHAALEANNELSV